MATNPPPASWSPRTSKPRAPIHTPPPKAKLRGPLFPFLLCGTAFFFYLSYHGTSAYLQLSRPSAEHDQDEKIDLTTVYNKTARDFDEGNDSVEWWWGIMKLRKHMVRKAYGHVLESAVGTGRNLEFYDRAKVQSLMMVDKSEGMLEVCREKWDLVRQGERWPGRVKFWVGDLEVADVGKAVKPTIGSQQVDEKFDTIIQTMGLCSTDDPERLLRSLGTLVKEDGRIMLLEHGRSHYDWLNRLLDQTAFPHAARHGCWWNRDIGNIIQESGLEVVEMKRHTLGTTWLFELKRVKADKLEAERFKEIEKPSTSNKSGWSF